MWSVDISVKGVPKRFVDRIAVNEVSLMVYRGEIYGLFGPNGAGKTTLLSMIGWDDEPDSGEISIDGLNAFVPRVVWLPAWMRILADTFSATWAIDGIRFASSMELELLN